MRRFAACLIGRLRRPAVRVLVARIISASPGCSSFTARSSPCVHCRCLLLSLYFRRSTINLSVRLLCRVFLPSVGKKTRHNKRTDKFIDRKSTRLNSSHLGISYAVFCLKKKIQSVV